MTGKGKYNDLRFSCAMGRTTNAKGYVEGKVGLWTVTGINTGMNTAGAHVRNGVMTDDLPPCYLRSFAGNKANKGQASR